MSQPSWLQIALQKSHIENVVTVLEYREFQRQIIRRSRDSSSKRRNPPFPIEPGDQVYYSCSVGKEPPHRSKNRYYALEPYDRTRVLVPDGIRTDNHRYLNANWVRELSGGKWWIASQAPLPHTIHAFLTLGICPAVPHSGSQSRIAAPRRVHTLVQLTTQVDAGQGRSHAYFPTDPREDTIVYPEGGCTVPPIRVHLKSQEYIEDARCVISDLRLQWELPDDEGFSRHTSWQVTHLLYTAWPDFGVPQDTSSILTFATLVDRVNNRHLVELSNDPNSSPPVMIHCSAGVGRTGSFLALCSLLRAYSLMPSPRSTLTATSISPASPLTVSPLGPLPMALDSDLVAKEIDSLREQRPAMVQKTEQVLWIYGTLAAAFDGA